MEGGTRGGGRKDLAKPLAHGDAYQRMNFLYQAAYQVVAIDPALSRRYIRHMVLVARKLVLRIDARVKSTYCKNCYSLLIEGLTATVHCSHGARHQLKTVCLCCGEKKKKK